MKIIYFYFIYYNHPKLKNRNNKNLEFISLLCKSNLRLNYFIKLFSILEISFYYLILLKIFLLFYFLVILC